MRDDVRYEVRGSAAWLTLDREERRNALGPAGLDLLLGHVDRAEADPAVRVICLTGAGREVFCSGADLAAALGGGEAAALPARYARLLQCLRASAK
ncbi:MAG TPA: enoyl-CoA hydratase/isomerase family protein, partial [Anaeromyxobacter sp.]